MSSPSPNLAETAPENSLFHQAESRARELAILNKAGQALASTLDLTTILEQIMVEVNHLFQAEGASVLLPDPAKDELVFAAVATPEARGLIGARLPLATGVAGWVMQHHQPLLLADAQQDWRFNNRIDAITGMTTRSLLAVPLLYKQKAIGVVEVVNNTSASFNPHDLELLETLAGSAAIAIENARLYQQVERHAQQLNVLHELDRAITTSLRLNDIYHAFYLHTARLFSCDCVSIALVEHDQLHTTYTAGKDKNILTLGATLSRQTSAVGWVITHRQPLLRHNITTAHFDEDEQLLAAGIKSAMIMPLRVKGQIIGAWHLGSRDIGAYQADDLQITQSMTDQLAIAIENARLFEQVRTGQEQMRQLAQQILTAQEEERQRLSYVLHDEAGQALTVLKIWLESIRDELPPNPPGLRERMAEAVNLTASTMASLRSLAKDLRPPALDVVGLNDALEDLCRDFARRTNLTVNYTGRELPPLADPAMICLYRFLQEALTNVAKHAQASQVWVTLQVAAGRISLSVQDNGQGFTRAVEQAISDQMSGIGLLGLRERLKLLHGWLALESQPGQGASVTAYVPLQEA